MTAHHHRDHDRHDRRHKHRGRHDRHYRHEDDDEASWYWTQTRLPLASLVFVLPMLALYETGVRALGGPRADALRTGADAWLRIHLHQRGLTSPWILPAAVLVVLLVWQVVSGSRWRFGLLCLTGMALESAAWSLGLLGMARGLDIGILALKNSALLQVAADPATASAAATVLPESKALAPLIGYLGAGIYEETLFRLLLVPVLYHLGRLALMSRLSAGLMATAASGFVFALAHHVGAGGEPFTWYAFAFRSLAGLYFGWVFLSRGFGVAVGTHTAYDILVGWLGWHL